MQICDASQLFTQNVEIAEISEISEITEFAEHASERYFSCSCLYLLNTRTVYLRAFAGNENAPHVAGGVLPIGVSTSHRCNRQELDVVRLPGMEQEKQGPGIITPAIAVEDGVSGR